MAYASVPRTRALQLWIDSERITDDAWLGNVHIVSHKWKTVLTFLTLRVRL